ncbi:MAG TPA: hypothetical protein VFJ11_08345 [Gaiellaceae bacterium]|nr:hypothetical protein [Gaiellaceae bacterium]
MLDREKLKRLGLKVVEPTDEDEEKATVYVLPREVVAAVKADL